MYNTVRTHMGALLQTCQKQKVQFVIPPNTTLNQTFGVYPDMVVEDPLQHSCTYFCIGIGGVSYTRGTNGLFKTDVFPHSPADAGLYEFLPHIVRPVANDLTTAERAMYRMRVVKNVGGVDYALYYLRILPAPNYAPIIQLRNGNGQPTAWTFPVESLRPKVPTLKPGQVMTTGDDVLFTSCPYTVEFTEQDVTEILAAAQLLFGDEGYATVVEIGVCAAQDRVLPGNFNGASLQYTEAVSCFITDFLSTKIDFPAIRQGGPMTLEAGAAEPLLVITSTSEASVGG